MDSREKLSPETLASLEKGLEQSKNGEVEYLGNFSQWLNGAVTFDTDNISEPDEDQIAYSHYLADNWDS
jgi:hypothetical protein